ncbi:replication protein [Loigolactobacillus coryniformis]|uniref:replication protein n=1 Tax=Loigolactobacillus coryniformis TaxID=1610 RepID=UPI00201B0B18|nr:replication protein [Loigolactobacillus coryniformis]MCL5458056.1 replication protein [Loigolactobacillus coryniformis]
MAQRRMFSKKITDTDSFMELPLSSQALYFHLNMHADDDGFISNAKTIVRMTGASTDDFKLLIAKQFIITFETGVIVIKDWRIHNYIRSDRYTKTVYSDEKGQLATDENGRYIKDKPAVSTNGIPDVIPDGYQMDTQVRLELGKGRLGKDRDNIKPSRKARKRVYQSGEIEFELADYLFQAIKGNNPEAKQPNMQTWSNDIRLMIERDKRTPTQIRNMIDWCQSDSFWMTNILSPKKLREKYDQMKVKALKQQQPDKAAVPPLPANTPTIPMYDWATGGDDNGA